MKRKDSLARKGMKLLCTLLGLVFAVMLGTTLLFRQYLNQIHYAPPQTTKDASVLEVFSGISLGFSDGDRIGGSGSDLVNILLIGQDLRPARRRSHGTPHVLPSSGSEELP